MEEVEGPLDELSLQTLVVVCRCEVGPALETGILLQVDLLTEPDPVLLVPSLTVLSVLQPLSVVFSEAEPQHREVSLVVEKHPEAGL